ncbi:SNF2 family N-terminal domain-containing protein, partial [Pisolithus croceorrhizus]
PRRTRASATPATTATTAATGASDSPSMTDQLCRTRNTPHFRHRVAGNHPKNISRTPVLRMKIQRNAPPTHIEEIQPVVAKHRVVPKSVFVAISSKLELIEESGFSGSEFELSELDDIPVNGTGEIDYMPPSDEEEVQMMTVSIEISRQTARLGAHRDSGAGLSSGVAPKKAPLGAFNRHETDLVLGSDEDSELSKLTHDESALAKHEDDDDDFGDESAFTATSNKLGRTLTLSERSRIRFLFHHPELPNVWKDLKSLAVVAPGAAHQPAGLRVTLLRFQQESLSWMRQQEESIWKGGILWCRNHVHGMGHTIQMISLSVSDVKRPNLVIGPTVVLMQWRNEIHAHMENIIGDYNELKKYDVSCFRKQQSGFKRKGLIIKEKITPAPYRKSCFESQSNYKWCLSGTPLQNRLGELYSLVHYPGGDPFSYYLCRRCDCKSLHWRFIGKKTCDFRGQVGFKKLRILPDQLMLRRAKIQRADDLGLPPRTVIVRRDYFSPEEKELYLSLFAGAKRQFNIYYVHSGTVLNKYSPSRHRITRVRQMACHPSLVLRSMSNGNQFFNTEELGERTVCRLCSDFAEDAIQTKSRHIFDRECIKQYLSASCDVSPKCPIYHLPLTIDLEAPALELAESAPVARQGILGRLDLDTWQSPSKIEALVEELSNLRLQDVAMKRSLPEVYNLLSLVLFVSCAQAHHQVCQRLNI